MGLKQRIDQTKRYYKRNGFAKTASAVTERVLTKDNPELAFTEPHLEELMKQRETVFENGPKISVLVPAYETKEHFFIELIDSMLKQTYSNWELIIADGSKDDHLSRLVIADERIRYIKLEKNLGISRNTNEALKEATGDYIGLLDHDDCLTPDCLFYAAKVIVKSRPAFLYTDEDKADEEMFHFFEPSRKRKFNLDLLLSNNYICHFLVMRADLMKELKFRPEFDGSQDYDLILRAAGYALDHGEEIVHIPRILYHWRCYNESTALNTDSKTYAYENGKKAIEDFCKKRNWEVVVDETPHLGFYKLYYYPDLFANREKVGAVCGPIYSMGRISGGAMHADGTLFYKDLPMGYSGYLHRASLQQEVSAGDVRNMKVREELKEIYDRIVGDPEKLNVKQAVEKSVVFCDKIRKMGYSVVYDPSMKKKRK